MSPGEDKAWKILSGLDPADVCRNACVAFDNLSGSYVLRSLGMDLHIDPGNKKIHCNAPEETRLIEKIGYFSIMSVLWYLVGSRETTLSGKLIKPENLKGGLLFFRGTHVLPLDRLASRYQDDKDGFILRGEELGGERSGYGDASVRLVPLPRVPVVIILWRGDDEFPPRADLLFDSTCELHLALDVLWAVAMQSILMMI